jgi:hypothetical protein
MGEAAMDVGASVQEIAEGNAAEDGKEQHAQGEVPHPRQRGDVGGIEQVLRGRIPGIPG